MAFLGKNSIPAGMPEGDVESEPSPSDGSFNSPLESLVKNLSLNGPEDADLPHASALASALREDNQFDLRNEHHLRMILQATSTEHQIRDILGKPEYKHCTSEEKQRIVETSLKKMAEFGVLDPKVLEFGGKAFESHRNAVRVYLGSLIEAVSGDIGEAKALKQGIPNFHLDAPMGFQIQTPRMGLEALGAPGPGTSAIFGPRWEEVECLGKGGFGSVWACKNLLDDEIYAIKKIIITEQFLKVAQIADEKDRERAFAELHHEVKVLARLDHPNIVRYYSSWMERMSREQFEQIKKELFPDGLSGYTDDGRITLTDSNEEASSVEDSDDEDSEGNSEEDDSEDENSNDENSNDENSPIIFQSRSVSEFLSKDIKSLDLSDARQPQTSFSGSDIFERSSNLSSRSNGGSELEIVPRSISHLALPTIIKSPYVHILSIQMAKYSLSLNDFIKTPDDRNNPPQDFGIEYQFQPKIAVELMLRIVDGVEYMHHYHLVHRDLKPANVFLKLEKGPIGDMQGSVRVSGCKCSHRGHSCPENAGCLPGELYWVTPKIGDFGLTADIKRILELANENKALKKSLPDPVVAGTAFYM
ncbi:hypothetical protein ABW20_dc0110154 [Dactylellina cionopaga]|nr:hypothetical protein ABW20_dc0110154 [Dactylellina cionopaga]